MALLVTPATTDTPSTDGNCVYLATPLGGTPNIAANVLLKKQPIEFYDVTSVLTPATSQKVNPLIPAPCVPGNRVIQAQENTTVFINKKLPAVTGDSTLLFNGNVRSLVAPFGDPTLVIGSKL